MPNIVITSNDNRVLVEFNDLTVAAGMPSGDWNKTAISLELNLGNSDLFFIVQDLQQWRFSYNGSINSLQVDSVDGVVPISNADLKSKLDAILAVQTIPDQTGNNGKYLTTDGSSLSWATVTGGSGLSQQQVEGLI